MSENKTWIYENMYHQIIKHSRLLSRRNQAIKGKLYIADLYRTIGIVYLHVHLNLILIANNSPTQL